MASGSKDLLLSTRRVLFVEDDRQEIEKIEQLLAELQLVHQLATTIADAKKLLREESFDYLLTDLHIETKAGFEPPDGMQVIAFAREQQPNIVIVATSSDPRADIWNEALAAGAQQFIRKPLSQADELIIAFGLAKERKQLVLGLQQKPAFAGRWQPFSEQYPDGIVIDKMTFNKVKGLAKRSSLACVIVGETGTGKEEIAKLIHRYRCEIEGPIPFVAVNCATITSGLAESILFGHRKGAFTGAEHTTQGFVGEADGGILFLDEIHTLDPTSQQKMLRVLADGTYNRLGESRTYRSQFQLIAATTKDLDDEVDDGRFLLDLRGRMTGLDIKLPPLRERLDDIPALAALFLTKKGINLEESDFQALCDRLKSFYWRGNIRQLFKVLESWVLQCEFQELELSLDHFPIFKGMLSPDHTMDHLPLGFEKMRPTDKAAVMAIVKALNEDCDLEATVELFEKAVLSAALQRHASVANCCKALNVPRSTIDGKRRKYQI